MSQNRVCCNCRHNIRKESDTGHIYCECEVTGKYMGYVKVMNGWCRRWAKDKFEFNQNTIRIDISELPVKGESDES